MSNSMVEILRVKMPLGWSMNDTVREYIEKERTQAADEIKRLRAEIDMLEKCIDNLRGGDFWLFSGMCNVLADRLARHTGRTVPDEVEDAERAVKNKDEIDEW